MDSNSLGAGEPGSRRVELDPQKRSLSLRAEFCAAPAAQFRIRLRKGGISNRDLNACSTGRDRPLAKSKDDNKGHRSSR